MKNSFNEEYGFENDVGKMAAILSRPQRVLVVGRFRAIAHHF